MLLMSLVADTNGRPGLHFLGLKNDFQTASSRSPIGHVHRFGVRPASDPSSSTRLPLMTTPPDSSVPKRPTAGPNFGPNLRPGHVSFLYRGEAHNLLSYAERRAPHLRPRLQFRYSGDDPKVFPVPSGTIDGHYSGKIVRRTVSSTVNTEPHTRSSVGFRHPYPVFPTAMSVGRLFSSVSPRAT